MVVGEEEGVLVVINTSEAVTVLYTSAALVASVVHCTSQHPDHPVAFWRNRCVV
jgi:hypothetical protein